MQARSRTLSSSRQRIEHRIGSSSRSMANVHVADYLLGPANQQQGSLNEILELSVMVPLFDQIEKSHMPTLAGYMKIVRLDAQKKLFSEGERSDYMCFIVTGSLDVIKQSQTSESVSISTLGIGRSVGEMAMFDGYPRSASVVARTPCTLLAISRTSLDHIVEQRPRAGAAFMKALTKMLSQNLRNTSEAFADASASASLTVAVPQLMKKTAKTPSRKKASKSQTMIDHIINRGSAPLMPLINRLV